MSDAPAASDQAGRGTDPTEPARGTAAPGKRTRTTRIRAGSKRTKPATDAAPLDASTVDPSTVTSDGDPLLRSTPLRVAFRPTRVGDVSETRAVLITNVSTSPLELVDAIVHGAYASGFRVLGVDATRLEPREATTVHLVFTPTGTHKHLAHCTIETDRGMARAIPLIGNGRAALADAIATREPGAREESEARAHTDAKAAHLRAARQGAVHVAPTYASMFAAFELAVDEAARGDRARGLVLARAVLTALDDATPHDRTYAVLRRYGVGVDTPLRLLGSARDAVIALIHRIQLRSTIAPALYLPSFQAGRKVIELVTGESNDAGDFAAWDRATRATAYAYTAAVAAPLVIGGAIAAPGAAASIASRALPMIAAEVSLLWFTTRNVWYWASSYAAREPQAALAWTEFLAPFAIEGGENWEHRDEYLERLETREGFLELAMQMLLGLAEARAGGAFDAGPGPRRPGVGLDGDLDLPGLAPSRPRLDRSARPPASPSPAGDATPAAPTRVLPRAIASHAEAEPDPAVVRAVAADAMDRLRALVAAVKTARGVDVPRARSSSVIDGDVEPPLTAAEDGALVRDRDTTFGERYGHALHGRRAARAEARGALHDGGLGEAAITGYALRARGARELHRTDDVLMGDTLVTYQLPNGRQVSIRERGIAPPRRQDPRDPARARALQADAAAAREANAARDRQTDAQLRARLVRDGGTVHVDQLFERVIIGGGPTAVELYATRPRTARTGAPDGTPTGATAAPHAADGAPAAGDELDLSTIVIADTPRPTSWDDRPIETGQPGHETARTAFDVAPRDLVDEPIRYLPARALTDAAALTARNHAMPVWRGLRAVRIDARPDATWLHPSAARRIWLRDSDGTELAIYTRAADLAGGLGTPRGLEVSKLGPAPAEGAPDSRGAQRAALEAEGLLVSAEDHLSAGSPAGARRVLVSGGGATAPWNIDLVSRGAPGAEIVWIAAPDMPPRNPAAREEAAHVEAAIATARAELADVELHLARQAPDVDRLEGRRADLHADLAYLSQRRADLAFGDAMLPRNLDPDGAFARPTVRRVVAEIAHVEKVSAEGAPARLRITLSNGDVGEYDQAILNHGADPTQPGSTPSLLSREQLQIVPTGTRAHIASTDGAVRVFGAASFTVAGQAEARNKPAPFDALAPTRDPSYATRAGYENQPTYSRAVPSFYLAGEQVREANK